MTQSKFHISASAMMLFGLSQLLDSGKHDHITIDDVKHHVRKRDLIEWLKSLGGGTFAMNFCDGNPEFVKWYTDKIAENVLAMDGREKKVWDRASWALLADLIYCENYSSGQ